MADSSTYTEEYQVVEALKFGGSLAQLALEGSVGKPFHAARVEDDVARLGVPRM